MAKFYGPFYEGDEGIWHWHKDCPDFPTTKNPKMMVSTSFPSKMKLCPSCAKIDESSLKSDSGMKKFEG